MRRGQADSGLCEEDFASGVPAPPPNVVQDHKDEDGLWIDGLQRGVLMGGSALGSLVGLHEGGAEVVVVLLLLPRLWLPGSGRKKGPLVVCFAAIAGQLVADLRIMVGGRAGGLAEVGIVGGGA